MSEHKRAKRSAVLFFVSKTLKARTRMDRRDPMRSAEGGNGVPIHSSASKIAEILTARNAAKGSAKKLCAFVSLKVVKRKWNGSTFMLDERDRAKKLVFSTDRSG